MAKLLISVLLLAVAANAYKLELPKIDWRKQLDMMCIPGNPLVEGPTGEFFKSTCQLQPYVAKFCQAADLPAEQEAAYNACDKYMPVESGALLDSCSQEVFGAKYGIGIRHQYCTDGGISFLQCVINAQGGLQDAAQQNIANMKTLLKMNQCQWEALGFSGEYPMTKILENLPHPF